MQYLIKAQVGKLHKRKQRSLSSAINLVLERLEDRQLLTTVVQPLPFKLDFNSDQGGITDANGLGTGFTDVQPNKLGTQYQPSLINLDTTDGQLKITTTGTSAAGSNSLNDNTQVDALQTSFDATSTVWEVDARLVGPLSNLAASYDQGGIFFGPDQDNFVKLVTVHSGSTNVLQFKDEINGANPTLPSSVQNVNIGDFSKIKTLDLRMIGDPSTGKISAYYSVNGASYVLLSSALTLTGTNKTKWFSQTADAGILASAKNDLPPITVTFDSFGISGSTVTPVVHPSDIDVNPTNGSVGVSTDSFIAADVNLPNAAIDPTTLNGNVVLFRTSDGLQISGVVNTSGNGGAIIFQPSVLLDPNTNYTFQITTGVKDLKGNTFVPMSSTFTTGAASVSGGNIQLSSGTLYMNDVQAGNTDPGSTAKSEQLTITNNGTGPLNLGTDAFSITGTNASMFSVVANNLPQTLQPGDSYIVTVNFAATNIGIDTATLTINSDSPSNPAVTVNLRGIGMAGTEVANGLNEPSLQQILNLYQIPDTVGDDDPTTTAFPEPPISPNDEVTMQELLKAGSGDVSIQLLSVFDNIKDPATDVGYYAPGTPDNSSQLFSVPMSGAESVDPTINGNTSFDPGNNAFGLYATFPAFTNRNSYEEDALNTWDTVNPRKMRFYPLKNSDGSVVPNAYVFAFEDYNKAYDFNDVVGIIRNVTAAPSGAYVGTANLDGGLYNQLTFSRIQNLDPRVPNVTHNIASLEIRNTGSQPLSISSMVLNGPYTFVSGGNTSSIPADGTATVQIQFNGVGADMVDVMNGTLTINSNAVNQPVTTVSLSGIYQAYSEQSPKNVYSEPSLQQIVNAFGYTTVVANPNQETVNGAEVELGVEGQGVAVGQEILSGYWEQADLNAPVSVQMLAAYHKESGQDTSGNPENTFSTIKYYYQGASTSATTLFSHNQNEGQTILPHLNGSTTKYAAATFTPSSGKAFGFRVDGDYSDDSLNNLDWNHSDPNQTPIPGTGHSIRFYALRDANGNIVPNTYLMAQDYTGISYSNYDYQDNIYIVRNVMPVNPPAAPKNVMATAGASGIGLSWMANTEGNVAGYRVYRSDSLTDPFTLLNPTTPLTSTNFIDTTAPAGATSYYRITAVDLNRNESSYTSVNATAAGSSGGGTVTTTITAPGGLQVTNSTGSEIDLSWADNSNNETGFLIERSTGGSVYSTIFTTVANVTTFSDTTVASGQTYSYEVVATNGTVNSTASNVATATTTTPTQPQQAAMTSVDIGGVTPSGTTNTITDGSDYNITAGGANIWGTADQFRFTYEQMTGDFDVKVQVLSLLANDPKAKAGIMARASLGANAANAFARVNVTASNGPRLSYRATNGGASATNGTGDGAPMMWVRLLRVGNIFTMYRSAHGVNWTSVGSTTIAMGSTIYVGMATAADTAGQTVAAQYRSFGNTNSAAPVVVTIPAAPTNLAANAPSSSEVDLSWIDNSNNETGFKVQRRTADGTYETIFTTAAGATNWSDTTATAGMTYFYQVLATNSTGDSTASNEVQVITLTAPVTPITPTLPTFSSADIGGPTIAGSSSSPSSGNYDVTGSGSDVWGTSDQAQFEYTQLTGNFDISVQVNGATFAAGQNPLVGLMARASLNANAMNVFMRTYGQSGGQYKFAYRTNTGGVSASVSGGVNSYPNTWVRLTRVGNVFTGYSSSDGVHWTVVGTQTIAMGATVDVGMAVSSRSVGSTATGEFSNLSV